MEDNEIIKEEWNNYKLTLEEKICQVSYLNDFDSHLRCRYNLTIEDVIPADKKCEWITQKPIKLNPMDPNIRQCKASRKFYITYKNYNRNEKGMYQRQSMAWEWHKQLLAEEET